MVVSNNMIKPVSKNKPLICEQYWQNILKKTSPVKEYKSRVSTNFDLHTANLCFMNGNALELYLETETGMTLRKFIAQTDKEFKQLTPTDKPLVLWRGISAPLKEQKRYPRFENSYNCKVGDRIFMPEYAFAAEDEKTALSYALSPSEQNGIIYKIIVPEGSRINEGVYYNFPRFSIFECIKTKEITKDNQNYKLITLRYIQPEEIKSEPKKKVSDFLKRL